MRFLVLLSVALSLVAIAFSIRTRLQTVELIKVSQKAWIL